MARRTASRFARTQRGSRQKLVPPREFVEGLNQYDTAVRDGNFFARPGKLQLSKAGLVEDASRAIDFPIHAIYSSDHQAYLDLNQISPSGLSYIPDDDNYSFVGIVFKPRMPTLELPGGSTLEGFIGAHPFPQGVGISYPDLFAAKGARFVEGVLEAMLENGDRPAKAMVTRSINESYHHDYLAQRIFHNNEEYERRVRLTLNTSPLMQKLELTRR